MGDKKIILILIALTVLILGGAVAFLGNGPSSAKVPSSQNAKIAVDQKSFDWGRIPLNGGNINKTFTIRNTGTDTLKLYNIKTSCHCTKAQLKIGNTLSPYFGMVSTSSWVGDVPPGQEAQLEVIFDPAFHGPNGVGPINRLISVETNDVSNPRIEFSLTGTVFN